MERRKNARGKKARVEPELPNVQVKQEAAVHDANGNGGAGAGNAAAAAEVASRMEVEIKLDATLLHCPVCSDRLRPPVFQCEAGVVHWACSSCHGKLPGNRCHSCDDHGGAYVRSTVLDHLVYSSRIQCPHHRHGCPSYVAYYDASDHESACPHAPCSCAEPGCAFVGSPPDLLAHLTTSHSWPAHKIRYGTHLGLGLPASEPRLLLVAEEDDGAVFLVAVDALGPARAVSVVCLRANAEAGQQYALKLWAHGRDEHAIMLDSEVTSSAAPGEVAVEVVEFLVVPPAMMTGAEASKEMVLTICIDETS